MSFHRATKGWVKLAGVFCVLVTPQIVRAEALLQLFNVSWSEVTRKMPELAEAGYTSLWLPPPTKGSGGLSVGYDLWDPFDLGSKDQRSSVRTRYGTEAELLEMVETAHRFGIRVYFDNIMNHRAFDVPGYNEDTPIDVYPGMVPEDFHLRKTEEGFYRKWDNTRDWNSSWQVQNLGLADLIDIAHETPNANHGTSEGATHPKYSFIRDFDRPEQYDRDKDGNTAYFGVLIDQARDELGTNATTAELRTKAQEYINARKSSFTEDVGAYLIRAARWKIDRTKADGLRLDAVKHVPDYFFGQQSGAGKDTNNAGYLGGVQWQFNRTRGFSDANHRDTVFDEKSPRDDAMVFGEHLGQPPGYGGYWDAGMRLVDNDLRSKLNGTLGNASATLSGLDASGAGGFAASLGVTHANSHDSDYAAQKEWQHAYYMAREGMGLIYSDGYNKAETLGESGGAFPRHANTAYLGQFGDPRIPNILKLHNDFARGLQQGRWADGDYLAFERRDNRNPDGSVRTGNAADEITMVMMMNDNTAQGQARSISTSFPSGAYLYQYAEGPNNSSMVGFYKYAGELNTVTVPPGGYFLFSYRTPELSTLWPAAAITLYQTNSSSGQLEEVPRITVTRKDGRDGDQSFNPYNLANRGYPTNVTPAKYTYQTTVPVVKCNTPLTILARADGSAENILVKLDGGVDLNAHMGMGDTNELAKRDNPPGLRTDIFLGYEQPLFIDRQHPEKFAAVNTARCQIGSPGAETYIKVIGGSATNNNGPTNNFTTNSIVSFHYHDPNGSVGGTNISLAQLTESSSNLTIWSKTPSGLGGYKMFLYYTTNGSTWPEGAGGIGRGETRVAEMNWRHDQTGADAGSWWSVTNVPLPATGTQFRYKIGVYRTEKTTNSETPSWFPNDPGSVAYKKMMMTTFRVADFNPATVQHFPHNDYARTPTLGLTYSNWPFAMRTGLTEGFHVLRARAFLKRDGQAPLYQTFTQTFYYDAQTPQGSIAWPQNDNDEVGGSSYELVVRTDSTVEEVWYHIDETPNETSNDDINTKLLNGNGAGFEPFDDANQSGTRDPGEDFTDVNGNGSYDTNLADSWAKATEVTPPAGVTQKEWRFRYNNIPATGQGTITVRLLEASSSRNLTLSAAQANAAELTRIVNTRGPDERVMIAWPQSDGNRVDDNYTMKVYFTKVLADGTTTDSLKNRFTFSIASQESGKTNGAVDQSRSNFTINYNVNSQFHELAIPLPNIYNGVADFEHTLKVVYTFPGDYSETAKRGLKLEAFRRVTANPSTKPFIRIIQPTEFGSDGRPTEITLRDGVGPEPFVDTNSNGTRDAGETFTDVNTNNVWDGPDFLDYKVQVETSLTVTNAPTLTGIVTTGIPESEARTTAQKWTYNWRITSPGDYTITAETSLNGQTTVTSRGARVILRQGVEPDDITDNDDDHDGLVDIDETNQKDLPSGNAETWSNGDVHIHKATGRSLPTSPDSDGDGLPYGLEVGWRSASTPPTDTTVDTNADGVKNFRGDLDPPLYAVVEHAGFVPGVGSQSQGDDRTRQAAGSATDPAKSDTDGDGLLDGIEDANINGWTDGDGKSLPATAAKEQFGTARPNTGDWPNNFIDSFETWAETSPTKADSDEDGLSDGYGEDKNLNGFIDGDSDKDRTYDAGETWSETDPLKTDTDGDGLPDGWEDKYKLDPLDNGTLSMRTGGAGNANNGATGDPDQDGFTNAQELASGSHPTQPSGGGGGSGEGPISIGTFTQWTHQDLLVLDEYNEGGSQGADVYRSWNDTDNSRDIVAFSFRDGGDKDAGGDGRVYFRVDFLDLADKAWEGEVDAYIVIDTGNPSTGERSIPNEVDIATDMRWEAVVAVYGQNFGTIFVDRNGTANTTTQFQNPVTEGGVEARGFGWSNEAAWSGRYDAVEIAIEREHLKDAGWLGDPNTLNFQVFTTKPNTTGVGTGDLSGRNDIRDTIYDDWLASDYWKDASNIALNGKLGSWFGRGGAHDRNKSAKVMLLAHGNQAIQPASVIQSFVHAGTGSNAVGYARLIQTHKTNNAPLTLHLTPTLASALQWARSTNATPNNLWPSSGPNNDGPTLNQEIRSLVNSTNPLQRIDLVGSSFSDHVPKYFPLNFNQENKELAEKFLDVIYGSNAASRSVYWPTERVLDTSTLSMIKSMGYDYTFADQMRHGIKWFGRTAALGTSGYRINEVNGVKIFPIHDETSAYLDQARDEGSALAVRQLLSRRSRSNVQDQVVVLWKDMGDFLTPSKASSYEANVRWLASRPWIRVVTAQQIATGKVNYIGQDGNTYTNWDTIGRGTGVTLGQAAKDWVEWATGGNYDNWFNRTKTNRFGSTLAFGQVGEANSGHANIAWTNSANLSVPGLKNLAQITLGASMFQTAFHFPATSTDLTKYSTGEYINPASQTGQTMADFARISQAQTRFANVYARVQQWTTTASPTTLGKDQADIDLDGQDEYLLFNHRIFALFEAKGGRMTAAWLRDPSSGKVWQVAGNFASYANTDTEDEGESNVTTNNVTVNAYRTSGFKDWWAITGGSGSNSSVNASNTVTTNGPAGWTFTQGGIAKTITLPGANTAQIQAQYSLTGPTNLYVRFGLSPDLEDLKIRGASALAPEVTTGSGTNRRSSVSNVRMDRIVRAWVRAEGLNPGATDRGTGFTTVDRRNQAQTHQMEVLVTTNPSTQMLTLGFDTGGTNVLTFTPPPKVTFGQTIDLATYTQSSIEGPVTYNFSLVGGNTNQVRLNGSQLTIDSGTGDVTVRVESPDYPTTPQMANILFDKATAAITSWTNLNQVEGSTGPVDVMTAPLGLNTVVTYVAVGSSEPASSNPPSLPGLYRVMASVDDQNYRASDVRDLTVRSRFANLFNDAPANSDTDGDGVPALLEYAFDGSVGANDQSKLPEMNLTNGNLALTAVVRTDDPTLIIEPVRTTNLGLGLSGWSTNQTSQTNSTNTTGVPAGFQRKIFSTTVTNDPRVFLRLQIRTNSTSSNSPSSL